MTLTFLSLAALSFLITTFDSAMTVSGELFLMFSIMVLKFASVSICSLFVRSFVPAWIIIQSGFFMITGFR